MKPKKRPKAGFIYFLEAFAGHSQGVKIGFSTKPRSRFEALKSEVGVRLRLIGYVPGTMRHEKNPHAILRHRRCHGEWFYTGNVRLNNFIKEIVTSKRLPPDLIKNAERYHVAFGGGIGICACGRSK